MSKMRIIRLTREKVPGNQLRIRCRKHPRYNAVNATKKCASCSLLYILRYQHSKEPEKHLGGIDPYQFIGSVKEAAEGLEVWFDEKLKPLTKLESQHLPLCPAFIDNRLECKCKPEYQS